MARTSQSLLVCTIESTTYYVRSAHSLLFVDSRVIVRIGCVHELVSTVIGISLSMLVSPTTLDDQKNQHLQVVHEKCKTEE